MANDPPAAFGDREIPLQIAVMGCVVNGPGEARDADLGIAAGRQKGHLFLKGRNIAVVPEDEMVDTLVRYAERIMEVGADHVLAESDTAKAEKAAAEDRAALLEVQGSDVNDAGARIDLIRKRVDGA